jgi:radical SAM modification target selenobiotic family peptide
MGLCRAIVFFDRFFYFFLLQEVFMANKDLKKFLAGLGVAGLITAGGITLPGAHAAGSG